MYKVIDYPEGSEVGTIIGTYRDQTNAHFIADKTSRGHKCEVYLIGETEDILVYRTKGVR